MARSTKNSNKDDAGANLGPQNADNKVTKSTTNPPGKKTTGGKAAGKATVKKKATTPEEEKAPPPPRPTENLIKLSYEDALKLLQGKTREERIAYIDGQAKGLAKANHQFRNHVIPVPETEDHKGSLKDCLYDREGDYVLQESNHYSHPRFPDLDGFPMNVDAQSKLDVLGLAHYVPKKSEKPKKGTQKAGTAATTTTNESLAARKAKLDKEQKAAIAAVQEDFALWRKEADEFVDRLAKGEYISPHLRARQDLDTPHFQKRIQLINSRYAKLKKDEEEKEKKGGAEGAEGAEEAAAESKGRENKFGTISTALKYEFLFVLGKFGLTSRPGPKAGDYAKEQWQKALRYLVAHTKVIPDNIRVILASGSSILKAGEDFDNPTIKRTEEWWTQRRRFFWHALDVTCHNQVKSANESITAGLKSKAEFLRGGKAGETPIEAGLWLGRESASVQQEAALDGGLQSVVERMDLAEKKRMAEEKGEKWVDKLDKDGIPIEPFTIDWNGYQYFQYPYTEWSWTLWDAFQQVEADEDKKRAEEIAARQKLAASQALDLDALMDLDPEDDTPTDPDTPVTDPPTDPPTEEESEEEVE